MYDQSSTSAYSENTKKQTYIKIIDITIVAIIFLFIFYVFILNQDFLLKMIIGIVIAIIATIYCSIIFGVQEEKINVTDAKIQKFALLNERGAEIDEWIVENQTSFLIGKSTSDNKVDIDLSGTEYEALINYEHAVLNHVSGVWYIEDIDSVNGVGIKKAQKRVKNRLKHENPYPIGNGDTIYIANTRILVK